MLDRAHRLRRRNDFTATVRTGRRAGRSTLVVHLRRGVGEGPDTPPRAGFIVSRAVGGAVVRNTVQRRLRHLVRDHLAELPAGSMLVIRALPPAGQASASRLGADLAAAMAAAARAGGRSATSRAGRLPAGQPERPA